MANFNERSLKMSIMELFQDEGYFKPVRELPAGRGFADFVYIPKLEHRDSYPALVVELKWNKNAETAINQIKKRNILMHCRDMQNAYCWLVSAMKPRLSSIIAQSKKIKNSLQAAEKSAAYFLVGCCLCAK